MKKPATSRMVTIITKNVKNGEWKIGKPIPAMKHIAYEYGTTAKTVKNAITKLIGTVLDVRGTKVFAIDNQAFWTLQSEKKNAISQIKVSCFLMEGAILDKISQYVLRNDGSSVFVYDQFIDKAYAFNKQLINRCLISPVFFEDIKLDSSKTTEYIQQVSVRQLYLDSIVRNKKHLDLGE